MTPTDIARLRLHNQQIAHATLRTPGEVVAHMGAVQAQALPGSKWAVGLRLPGVTEADIERAIADREIVRTWPMRRTLHLVAAADVRWMIDLLAVRQNARMAGRYRQLELDEETFRRSGEVIARALAGGSSLSRPQVYGLLQEAGISTSAPGIPEFGQIRGLHILAYHAQSGLICCGPPHGKQPAFVLLDEWVPESRRLERDEALPELATRYFTSHGPATIADFPWWSGLTVREAREAIDLAAGHLAHDTVAGQTFYLGPSSRMPRPRPGRAYLLPPFDEFTVAYKDRSAVLDPAFAGKAIAGGMFRPMIVVGGQVAGTWKRTLEKGSARLTLSPLRKLSEAERDAIVAAAARYGRFLRLGVTVER